MYQVPHDGHRIAVRSCAARHGVTAKCFGAAFKPTRRSSAAPINEWLIGPKLCNAIPTSICKTASAARSCIDHTTLRPGCCLACSAFAAPHGCNEANDLSTDHYARVVVLCVARGRFLRLSSAARRSNCSSFRRCSDGSSYVG
jgi:hypothetical protein